MKRRVSLQAAVAVISGAAVYMQRRTPSADAFGGSSGGSVLFAPFAAVGSGLVWVKDRIPGRGQLRLCVYQG